jgi:hypothetical protein
MCYEARKYSCEDYHLEHNLKTITDNDRCYGLNLNCLLKAHELKAWLLVHGALDKWLTHEDSDFINRFIHWCIQNLIVLLGHGRNEEECLVKTSMSLGERGIVPTKGITYLWLLPFCISLIPVCHEISHFSQLHTLCHNVPPYYAWTQKQWNQVTMEWNL